MFYRPEIARFGCNWYLTRRCNYACDYCFDQSRFGEQIQWDLPTCFRAFRDFKEQRGPMQIWLTGGEPTIHPQFAAIARELSQEGHLLFVTTNLSRGAKVFLGNITQPEYCHIDASLHLKNGSLPAFLTEVWRLYQTGFSVSCSGVLYPPLLEKILDVKDLFGQRHPDIYFGCNVFFGTYQGLKYPDSYTHDERERIRKRAGIDVASRIAGIKVPPQTLCRAGKDYFVILHDGSMMRCNAGDQTPLPGRFPNFELLSTAQPCPLGECWCPDQYEFWQ